MFYTCPAAAANWAAGIYMAGNFMVPTSLFLKFGQWEVVVARAQPWCVSVDMEPGCGSWERHTCAGLFLKWNLQGEKANTTIQTLHRIPHHRLRFLLVLCFPPKHNISPFFPNLEVQGALANSAGAKRCFFSKKQTAVKQLAGGDLIQEGHLGTSSLKMPKLFWLSWWLYVVFRSHVAPH